VLATTKLGSKFVQHLLDFGVVLVLGDVGRIGLDVLDGLKDLGLLQQRMAVCYQPRLRASPPSQHSKPAYLASS